MPNVMHLKNSERSETAFTLLKLGIMAFLFILTSCIKPSDQMSAEGGSNDHSHFATALSVPSLFTETTVASGLGNPTAMEFAPDGRLFVSDQGGQLRVIKNGSLLGAPFQSFSVDNNGEHGLLGIAFDPNYSSNRYIYVYYPHSETLNATFYI